MKQLILIISLISVSLGQAFQAPIDINIGKISGRVIDKDLQEPIPYATIVINDLEEKLVSGNISEDDGSFSIQDIPAGAYIFQVQFMGYKTYSQKIELSRNSSSVDFGVIALEMEVASLGDVTVVAERSTIEQKIDRKVINVGKDLTTVGATASDIMGNLPTLNVDQDGNISMRGNENVSILIDGRPSEIPAAQLLKQIPSSSIKSIELITNPSAKYNPEGMSGIINIILHKNTNLGFNGNLNTGLTAGLNVRGNGSVDLNYRTEKFNFFGNVGGNFGKNQQRGKIDNLANNSSENILFINDRESYLVKAGVDFYLDDNNTFSAFTTQNYSDGNPLGQIDIIYENQPQLNVSQDFFLDNSRLSSTYNFNYKRKFAKDGHTLEFESNFNTVDESELARFRFSGDPSFTDYRDDVEDDITNNIFNLDYVNPLNDRSKFEMGAEARLRKTSNNYETTNASLEDLVYDYDNSIYSFYTTFGQNFDKWSYQLGARLEQYDVEATVDGNRVFEDDYLTVYPTAFVSYKLSDMKSLQLSYGRRVDRPGLSQVNPVREFSTPRLTQVGNPELDPQFTNSVEFNYTQSFTKGSLTAGAFYRSIENEINQTILLDPEDPSRFILTYMNGQDNNARGVEVSGSYKPFKWWSINPSAELYNKTERGVVGTEMIEVDNTAFNFRLNQSFTATENLTFQLFGLYRSPSRMLQFNAKEMYFINAGARYNILDNKGTLSLNFNDIFNTQQFAFETDRPVAQAGRFKPESRTVFLGFSYRFGSGKSSALKRKNRDANEKQGGGIF